MTYDEDPESAPDTALYASSAAATEQRSSRRRKQALVGVAGVAAVLAGAGFLATQLIDDRQPALPEPAALAPMTSPATTESTPAVVVTSLSRTPEVTKQAAPVQRSPVPPPPSPSVEAVPEPDANPDAGRASSAADELRDRLGLNDRAELQERTEALGDGQIRIVSARRDLSGERLTLLSGDEGRPVGRGVRCTSEIRYVTGMPVTAPGTLLCWRTSANRSVITVASAAAGSPAAADSIAVISREWIKLN